MSTKNLQFVNFFQKTLDNLQNAIYNKFKVCKTQSKEVVNMSHYVGICSEMGNCVGEEDAFLYAVCRILCNDDEQKEFVEWYYSGNWIKEED